MRAARVVCNANGPTRGASPRRQRAAKPACYAQRRAVARSDPAEREPPSRGTIYARDTSHNTIRPTFSPCVPPDACHVKLLLATSYCPGAGNASVLQGSGVLPRKEKHGCEREMESRCVPRPSKPRSMWYCPGPGEATGSSRKATPIRPPCEGGADVSEAALAAREIGPEATSKRLVVIEPKRDRCCEAIQLPHPQSIVL